MNQAEHETDTETGVARLPFGLLAKFAIPSLLGVLIFLTPIKSGGQQTVLIGLITDWLRKPLQPILLECVVGITLAAFAGGLYYLIAKPDWETRRPLLYAICQVSPAWLLMRAAGASIAVMVYFKVGPELIWGEATGATVFNDIGIPLLVIFVTACMLMPFLTEFGFMEFVGTLVRKMFAFLFKLPGRSAIDATASFVSAAAVGLLITINQYERGYYTAREAGAVATNFSVVSIPFSLLIAEVAGIRHMYFSWYVTVIVACILCALITVRIPPISWLPDTYYGPTGKRIHEVAESDMPLLSWSLKAATDRARTAPGPVEFVRNGFRSLVDALFGVLGPSMAIATFASVVAFHTPIFDVLAAPIAWTLELAQLPEAKAAAPGFLIGFLDQFIPALFAKNIESELTRFVLAGLSVCQLIYMAEVGVLILRSSLPLRFWHLLVIFLLRTVILFPVLLIAGHWLL